MPRYLVVANQTLGGEELAARLKELADAGPCELHIVVPITQTSGSDHAVDGPWAPMVVHDGLEVGRRLAEGRLRHELARLSGEGIPAEGEVVDAMPIDHIRELVGGGSFDAVVVSTLPHRLSRWLRLDLPHRIGRASGLPTEHVVSSAGPSL